MSFCRAADIGKNATAETVKSIEQLLSEYGVVFYKPSHRWFVANSGRTKIDSDKWLVDSTQHIISLSGVKHYPFSWDNSLDVAYEDIDGRFVTITSEGELGALAYTGETGIAAKVDLSANTPLKAGDTILRGGIVTYIEADQNSVNDDVQLVAPASLKLCAIGVGRRLYKLSFDENAKWDDGMNTLIDGWEDLLSRYI